VSKMLGIAWGQDLLIGRHYFFILSGAIQFPQRVAKTRADARADHADSGTWMNARYTDASVLIKRPSRPSATIAIPDTYRVVGPYSSAIGALSTELESVDVLRYKY